MFRQRTRYASCFLALATVMLITASAYAQTPSSSASIPAASSDSIEAFIDVLRPWVQRMDALSTHAFFAPAMSAFFFLMLLTFAKRSR